MNRISFLKTGFGILSLAISFSSIAMPVKNIHDRNVCINSADKVIISGIIKDESGSPVENAKIIFDSAQVAITDKTGAYSFELGEITPTSHNIYFNGDGFATIVRSYYPIMGSASFNIMLRKPFGKAATVALEPVHPLKDTIAAPAKPIKAIAPVVKPPVVVVKNEPAVIINKEPVRTIKKDTIAVANKPVKTSSTNNSTLDLPSILFKPNLAALSGANKAFLDIIAGKLNDNPTIQVAIKANVPARNANWLIAKKRVDNIVRYLVEKNGIDSSRLIKQTITGGGDVDIIDIVNAAQ